MKHSVLWCMGWWQKWVIAIRHRTTQVHEYKRKSCFLEGSSFESCWASLMLITCFTRTQEGFRQKAFLYYLSASLWNLQRCGNEGSMVGEFTVYIYIPVYIVSAPCTMWSESEMCNKIKKKNNIFYKHTGRLKPTFSQVLRYIFHSSEKVAV